MADCLEKLLRTEKVKRYPEDEDLLEDYLKESRVINPQELAENILDEAVRRMGGYVSDDMSVIVTGIWERNKIK